MTLLVPSLIISLTFVAFWIKSTWRLRPFVPQEARSHFYIDNEEKSGLERPEVTSDLKVEKEGEVIVEETDKV